MNPVKIFVICFITWILGCTLADGQVQPKPKFRVLALAETGGGHAKFDEAAKIWLNQLAVDSNFTIDYIADTKTINKKLLKQYQLFIQLDYPPYPWEKYAQDAFVDYIEQGKGGWIGFHHPTLLGVFDNYPMWQWFSDYMGGIQFKNYIAGGTTALLKVEDSRHPVMNGIPATFQTKDQWYIYDKSPRPNVRVLASIDEATYVPASKINMGDHPVIWTNEHLKARNIYIAMGHYPQLLQDSFYTRLISNAIFWAVKNSSR